jgi:hypothetical protein
MIADDIRTLLNAQPFQPFTLYMASEKAYTVPHPEFASLSPRGRTLILWRQKGGYDQLDVQLIARVEVQSSPGKGTMS